MQEDGRIILMQVSPESTLKTISFFNAYCVGMQTSFMPGASGGGSLQMHIRISPQRVAVGAIVHDNNWPLPSHGAGEAFAKPQQSNPKAVPVISNTSLNASIPPIQKQTKATSKPGAVAMKSVASTCPESVRAALQRDVAPL